MTRTIGSLALVAAIALVGLNVSPDASAQTKTKTTTTTTKETATTGKTATFELYKDRGGEFRFRLKDADGDQVAASHKGYKTKDDAAKVIATIKAEASRARVDDQTSK
jgi:uncharacterized protein YegP (UPF0339 family)